MFESGCVLHPAMETWKRLNVSMTTSFAATERDEGFAHPGEIRGFRHVLSWKENLFQHIGFGNSCMETDVRGGKHQKMLTSEQKPFSSAPFFF